MRLICIGHCAPPGLPILEGPAGVEHRVDEAPGPDALAVKRQLGAEEVHPAAIDPGRHATRVPQELADVEARVAG